MNSHAFNLGIIYCYNNLWKYKHRRTDDYLIVHQLKKDNIFLFNAEYDYTKISERNAYTVYCSQKLEHSKIIKETCYDLTQLFTSSTKAVRRGITLKNRNNIFISDKELTENDRMSIFNSWKEWKNERVFRITFNPERYSRSYHLKDIKQVNYYERIVYVNFKPYAVINFSLENDIAFEISFVSKFFDKELRFINDLNECILINCFHDLYQNYGIKTVNVGPDGGLTNLKKFKDQFPHFYNPIYSISIKKELATLL